MFAGAGAVAAYFLDPDSGRDRRQRLMDQFGSMTGGEPPQPGEMRSDGRSDLAGSAATAADSGHGGGAIDLATGAPISGEPARPTSPG